MVFNPAKVPASNQPVFFFFMTETLEKRKRRWWETCTVETELMWDVSYRCIVLPPGSIRKRKWTDGILRCGWCAPPRPRCFASRWSASNIWCQMSSESEISGFQSCWCCFRDSFRFFCIVKYCIIRQVRRSGFCIYRLVLQISSERASFCDRVLRCGWGGRSFLCASAL